VPVPGRLGEVLGEIEGGAVEDRVAGRDGAHGNRDAEVRSAETGGAKDQAATSSLRGWAVPRSKGLRLLERHHGDRLEDDGAL
jgi:hypothetical protein